MSGDSYCDVSSPLLFGGEETIDNLMQKDRRLLVDIMIHNQTWERLCPD